MSKVIPGIQYSREHEWVAFDDVNPARVGLSAVAAEALGDIVYIELPEVGDTVTAGQICGEVESTKSVSELYSPVTGNVTAINASLAESPEKINTDPYGDGWLFEVGVESKGPLLTAQEYADLNQVEL